MHNFFIDNGLYRKLTETGKEDRWNVFYDSLIANDPVYKDADYKILFTSASLLEAIGLGKELKQSVQNQFIRPELTTDAQIKEAPINIYHAALKFYRNHKDISPDILIKKIDQQKNIYSSSAATTDLVTATLGYYRRFIKRSSKKALRVIIEGLAWDAACSFTYIELEKMTMDERQIINQQVELLYNALFSLWYYELKKEKIECSFYRITDQINAAGCLMPSYLTAAAKKMNVAKINTIKLKAKLDPKEDLVDVDMIHFLTLGKYNFKINKYCPVIAFTSDTKEIINDRIILQLNTIQRFSDNSPSIQLPIVAGIVYFVNKDTCEIIDKTCVKDLLDHDQVQIKVDVNGKK